MNKPIDTVHNSFTPEEVIWLSETYSEVRLNGYQGSFMEWFGGLPIDWNKKLVDSRKYGK